MGEDRWIGGMVEGFDLVEASYARAARPVTPKEGRIKTNCTAYRYYQIILAECICMVVSFMCCAHSYRPVA